MAASKLTNKEKLKRYIYVSSSEAKYTCGGPSYAPKDATEMDLLNDFLKNNPKGFFKIIETVNKDNLVPYRPGIFRILAKAFVVENATDQIKPQICAMVLKIVKNDQDFFDFIKHVSELRHDKCKLPHSVSKTVVRYYSSKSAEDLAKSYALFRSYHRWSHKDLIKINHIPSDTPAKNVVTNYILFKSTGDATGEGKKLIDLMKKSDTLRTTKDYHVAVRLISHLKATINQVGPDLRKSAEVWNAVLPNMALPDVLQALPKLYKLGFLKKDSTILAKISDALTNTERVKASGIHPIEVFIQMKNFEKGGKPLDPKLLDHLVREKNLTIEEQEKLKTPAVVKCTAVMNNLQRCMVLACGNVQSFGKRYLITIDTTEKMDTSCLGNKNITGLEISAAFAWFLMRVEKDVTVAVFKEKEVAVIKLDKKGNLNDCIQKLRENKATYVRMASPIEWAASQKKHVDIFLTFIQSIDSYMAAPSEGAPKLARGTDALHKYRKKVNLPNAKSVSFCWSFPRLAPSEGPNMLEVAGLDVGVPKVVEAFCRGHFC